MMTGNDLIKLGFRPGRVIGVALRLSPEAAKLLDAAGIERELRAVLADPVRNATHPYFSELADILREGQERPAFVERAEPAPYKVWGQGIEPQAADQIKQA